MRVGVVEVGAWVSRFIDATLHQSLRLPVSPGTVCHWNHTDTGRSSGHPNKGFLGEAASAYEAKLSMQTLFDSALSPTGCSRGSAYRRPHLRGSNAVSQRGEAKMATAHDMAASGPPTAPSPEKDFQPSKSMGRHHTGNGGLNPPVPVVLLVACCTSLLKNWAARNA